MSDETAQAASGISRRGMLRGGLLAGAGVAAVGATSALLTGTAQAASLQPNWAFCIACNAMFWTGGSQGKCPGGTFHVFRVGDFNYEIWSDVSFSPYQTDWRFCGYCAALFWGGASNQHGCWGNNAGNGGHHVGTTNYSVPMGIPGCTGTSNPQAYWHYCTSCHELYYEGESGTRAGLCPWTLSTHTGGTTVYDMYWSGNY
jgi:hypothetical protein